MLEKHLCGCKTLQLIFKVSLDINWFIQHCYLKLIQYTWLMGLSLRLPDLDQQSKLLCIQACCHEIVCILKFYILWFTSLYLLLFLVQFLLRIKQPFPKKYLFFHSFPFFYLPVSLWCSDNKRGPCLSVLLALYRLNPHYTLWNSASLSRGWF